MSLLVPVPVFLSLPCVRNISDIWDFWNAKAVSTLSMCDPGLTLSARITSQASYCSLNNGLTHNPTGNLGDKVDQQKESAERL